MISSRNRFHRRKQVNRVYKQGSQVRGRALSMMYRIDSTDVSARIAVVVSKKVSKKAVDRNRIRRRVFETVRPHINELPPGFEAIFTVFDKRLTGVGQEDLEKQIANLIDKALKR